MPAKRLFLVALVFGGLSSCNSFNHYDIKVGADEPTSTSKKAKDTALATASLSDEQIHGEPNSPLANDGQVKKPSVSANCPVYHLPDLGTAPDLPYDQLDAMKKNPDPRAFDAAAEKQIRMLYQYISALKHNLRDSHQQYLKDCQTYLNGGVTSTQNSLGQ